MTIEIKDDLATFTEEELQDDMASGLHGVLGGLVHGYLFSYVTPKKLGWVLNSSTAYNFNDGLPRREPDVSFVTFEKMPVPPDEELTFPPDLAVEVVSKNDTVYEVEKKVRQYLQAGVSLVWVLHPVSQSVLVYRQSTGLKPQTYIGNEELDGENIIPGFKIKVSDLFV